MLSKRVIAFATLSDVKLPWHYFAFYAFVELPPSHLNPYSYSIILYLHAAESRFKASGISQIAGIKHDDNV